MGNRPQAVLRNNPFTAPQFVYPADLGGESQEPYCIFDIRDSVAKGGASKGTIALTVPTTLRVQYQANYESFSGEIFWGKNPTLPNSENGLVNAAQELGQSISNMSIGGLWDQLKNTIYAAGTSVSARAQRDFSKIVNPHESLLFKGMGLRKFTMDWTLVANNPAESDAIRNIIYHLKYGMHPSFPASADGGTRYLLYPENFVIGIFSPEDKYLFKTSLCALENLEVDYAGSGSPAFFARTGAPVDIRLTLSFGELEMMTKERIQQGA